MTRNVTIVKNAYSALAQGDIDTFLDTLDGQVEWHLPEHHPLWPGKELVGPQAVLEGHLARVAEIYDGFRIDIQRVTALGDTVLVEMRCRGKGTVTPARISTCRTRRYGSSVTGSACVGKSTWTPGSYREG